MSTISAFQPFISPISKTHNISPKPHSSPSVFFQRNAHFTQNLPHLRVTHKSKLTRMRSSEEDEQIPESVAAEEVAAAASPEQTETVAVPVSPADKLMMFFQAEGTMSESAISSVTQALQETEGISDLDVHISEGIATVELTKQTTIQATGVASSLVEAIQGAGFKLNTLNLSFEDDIELLTA